MEYKAYAANGDDKAPESIQKQMTELAQFLDREGFVLRTNGSKVVGTAFELGSNNKEIYLPWNKFNDKTSKFNKVGADAMELSAKFFSRFKEIKEVAQKITAVNAYMVLGSNLRDPVKFLVVWTPDGAETTDKVNARTTGFTAQSIKIACASKIPVFNLHNQDALQRCKDYAVTVQGITLDF